MLFYKLVLFIYVCFVDGWNVKTEVVKVLSLSRVLKFWAHFQIGRNMMESTSTSTHETQIYFTTIVQLFNLGIVFLCVYLTMLTHANKIFEWIDIF